MGRRQRLRKAKKPLPGIKPEVTRSGMLAHFTRPFVATGKGIGRRIRNLGKEAVTYSPPKKTSRRRFLADVTAAGIGTAAAWKGAKWVAAEKIPFWSGLERRRHLDVAFGEHQSAKGAERRAVISNYLLGENRIIVRNGRIGVNLGN